MIYVVRTGYAWGMYSINEVTWFGAYSGSALSLVINGRSTTFNYAQLAADAEVVSARLREAKLGSGDVLALAMSSSVAMVRLIYGALWHGSPLLVFDAAMGCINRNRLLELAGCQLLISDSIVSEVPAAIGVLRHSQLLDGDRPAAESCVPFQADALSLIVATSGSTGTPKGVMLTAKNLYSSAVASNGRLGLSPEGRWLNVLPLRHIGGLSIIFRCLQSGAEMVLLESFDPVEVWQQILHQGITHISLVPTMLYRLLEVSKGGRPPAGLHSVLVGGGALPKALAHKALSEGWPLCVTYGMSETASQVACDINPEIGRPEGYVGLPLDGFSVRVDPDGCIAVAGDAVMAGYLNPLKERGVGLQDGWFKTGDLGRIDKQGNVHVVGRADAVLISGGVNIHPAQVEQQLMSCSGVSQVAVIGVADMEWGTVLIAIYVGGAQPDELQTWARTHLSGAECPKQYINVDELPCDGMGKVARDQLQTLI